MTPDLEAEARRLWNRPTALAVLAALHIWLLDRHASCTGLKTLRQRVGGLRYYVWDRFPHGPRPPVSSSECDAWFFDICGREAIRAGAQSRDKTLLAMMTLARGCDALTAEILRLRAKGRQRQYPVLRHTHPEHTTAIAGHALWRATELWRDELWIEEWLTS